MSRLLLLLLLFCFFFFFLTLYTLLGSYLSCRHLSRPPLRCLNLGDLFDILVLVNSAVNFVLFCTMSRQFRKTFVVVFCCRPQPSHVSRSGRVYAEQNCWRQSSIILGGQTMKAPRARRIGPERWGGAWESASSQYRGPRLFEIIRANVYILVLLSVV